MNIGLCLSPSATHQQLSKIDAESTLVGVSKFCTVYIDDILIFSENVDEHIGHLCQRFCHLCEVGLKLHPQKYILGCPKVPYLGYVISAEGIFPNPDKILAVKEFPTTTNVRAARESLGLASYYRLNPFACTRAACGQQIIPKPSHPMQSHAALSWISGIKLPTLQSHAIE